MKKTRRICLLLVFLILMQALSLSVIAKEQEVTVSGCITLDGQMPLMSGQVLETAKAVILYELNSRTLIHAWNPDEKIDPSGMNKIMTALLALENGDPTAVVTVSKSALNSVALGSVSAGLKAGEEMTLLDLLYCMMVGSANDAAAVIAEHIGGSQAVFVTMMNERAEELGCTSTLFMNANGLSDESQYTTARDLAKITEAALQNETFVELFSAVSHNVPATNKSEERGVITTNYLMNKETNSTYYDERVTGGKTGALSTKDRSLISTAESGSCRYLAVVMSAQSAVTANGQSVKTFGNFKETGELLDFGFGSYSMRQLLDESRVMGQYAVTDGENDVLGRPALTISSMMPTDFMQDQVSYQCTVSESSLKAPVSEGQAIGTIEVWFGDVCVGQCDLLAMHNVGVLGQHNVSISAREEDKAGSAWLTWLLIGALVVLGLAVLTGIVLFIMRAIQRTNLGRWYLIRRKYRKGRR